MTDRDLNRIQRWALLRARLRAEWQAMRQARALRRARNARRSTFIFRLGHGGGIYRA